MIRLKARLTPLFYLRREDPFAAAVLPEFGFIERMGLQNDQELVLGAPAVGLLSIMDPENRTKNRGEVKL